PPGDVRVLDPQARPVRTRNGWIAITANTDTQAKAFLKAVGRSDLIDDPRFSSVAARVKNSGAWFRLRAESLADQTTEHWLAAFTQADIPAMPCNTLDSLPNDPHVKAVGLIAPSLHPTEGDVKSIRPTMLFDDEVGQSTSPARELGWDTRDVLRDMGMSDAEISKLVESGAAVDGRIEDNGAAGSKHQPAIKK
ncbi:MAG: CoA transferase, partial [Xanthobacteraceae bacterium]